MLRLLTSSLLVTLASASFCGDSAIPFSLEVLPTGQPILGCARPTCFGWAPNGQPVSNTGSFYRINDHVDGFIRAGRDSIPAFGPSDPRFYRPQAAICDAYLSSACSGANQWVGGISPVVNVTTAPTALQCCAYDSLLRSEDRGQATLHGGQIVVGGEVLLGELQVGFDYISDVSKSIGADGTVQYDVSIRRMPCAGLPDSGVSSKVPKAGGVHAFQAPNVEVEEPLALPPAGPQGPPPTNNGVLEELVQEEAVQLPPGTQFQQPPPPPPPQFLQPPPFQPQIIAQPQFIPQPQFVPQAPAVQYSAPAYSYGGAAAQDMWCFTGDMTVTLMDYKTKRMDEIKKDDWVLSASEEILEFVPVEFWLHRVPEQEAEFNEFETEDGKTIKLTDKHYIYKGDCSRVGTGGIEYTSLPTEAVFADQVHAGDCLFTLGADHYMHEVRVVRADRVVEKGIYAPMTASGRIVVNGIHASCHNIMQENSMGQTVMETVNKIHSAIFGSSSEENVEIPSTLSTLLEMADLVMPKHHGEL